MKFCRLPLVLAFCLLSACSSVSDKFRSETESKALSDWRTEHVITPMWIGFFANMVPAIHLIGLAFDTYIVSTSIDDLVLGNGAIIERETGCEGLLQDDDFNLYLGWSTDGRTEVEAAFTAALKAYQALDAANEVSSVVFARTYTRYATVSRKYSEKVFAKIGAKVAGKAVVKGFAGFVPLLGPVSAAAINYFIMNDLDKSSRRYFYYKASVFCG